MGDNVTFEKIMESVEGKSSEYSLFDNIIGIVAGAAAYKFAREDALNKTWYFSGGIIRTGCEALAVTFSLWAADKVRDKSKNIRTLVKAWIKSQNDKERA